MPLGSKKPPVGTPLPKLASQTSQYGSDTGEQLAWTERLRDVVVGAHLEPHDLIGLFGPIGQNDEGNR